MMSNASGLADAALAGNQQWGRCYPVLAAVWLFTTVPLAWLSAAQIEITVNSLRLAGMGNGLPMLTRWYEGLGNGGIYAIALAPGLLLLILHPLRTRRMVIVMAAILVVASIYFVFLGLLAALLAYVKVTF